MRRILLVMVGTALIAAIMALAGPAAFGQQAEYKVYDPQSEQGNSYAAHNCPQGPAGIHGECVSDSAHNSGISSSPKET